MSAPSVDPLVREGLISAGLLLAAYLAARGLAWLGERLGRRLARRAAGAPDLRLGAALRAPLTFALLLLGAYASLVRLPLQESWLRRLDQGLFVLAVLIGTLVALRAWGLLLSWYTAERAGGENPLGHEFRPLLVKLGNIFLVSLGAIALLQHFGIDVNSLVVSLGVGSLAVGLAAQGTLANMFGGFTLLVDRPFVLGDRIRLASGEVGDVEWIGMRATRLKTLDETLLVIPNALLANERVVNLSRPSRAIVTKVELGVAYGSDLTAVKRLLAEAALGSKYVLAEPAPVVLLTRFGEFALQLALVFQARDYTEQALAASDVQEAVYGRLQAAGIEIPFPVPRVIQESRDAPAGGRSQKGESQA